MEDHGKCPRCGAWVSIVYDSDGSRQWVHEVWRTCGCPMPAHITEYLQPM